MSWGLESPGTIFIERERELKIHNILGRLISAVEQAMNYEDRQSIIASVKLLKSAIADFKFKTIGEL